MEFYKVVTSNRESYLASFLSNDTNITLFPSLPDLLRYLIDNGFILQYHKGDIVEAIPNTFGIIGFLDHHDAYEYMYKNCRRGQVIMLKALAPLVKLRDYVKTYGTDKFASLTEVDYERIKEDKTPMVGGEFVWREAKESCCVTQKVQVLT